MTDFTQKLEDFFNPEILKQNLTIASLFIAVFDNFKATIIDKVKYFYFSGICDGIEQFKDYEVEVLSKIKSKQNRQIKATLLWLKQYEFITQAEVVDFETYTNLRNKLAHELSKMLIEGFPKEIYEIYANMVNLFNKIEKKWIIDIEMTINPPNVPYKDIDWEGITSVNIELMKIMTDIAFTGNEEYLQLIKNYKPEHKNSFFSY